jgi:hypothetical protein
MRYGIVVWLLIVNFALAGCKELTQTPTSASGETTISATEGEQNKPLKINANKKYVKHRQVNRRIIHRLHRLHRT